MATYARIFEGMVVEIIEAAFYSTDSPKSVEPSWKAGDEIPIDLRFTAEFVSTLVDITADSPAPGYGWSAVEADGAWKFNPPSPPVYS